MLSGGEEGNRTLDLLHAMQTLSQLSYFPKNCGTPGGIRTPYPLVRSQVLYPNELRAYIFGAIEGTRTPSIPLDRRTLYH